MNQQFSLFTGILGLTVGILLGLLSGELITSNDHSVTSPTVYYVAIRAPDHVARNQISLGAANNVFDCTKLVPLLASSDNLDAGPTVNPCVYKMRADYAGPAYLRVALLDSTGHTRAIATWRGMAK